VSLSNLGTSTAWRTSYPKDFCKLFRWSTFADAGTQRIRFSPALKQRTVTLQHRKFCLQPLLIWQGQRCKIVTTHQGPVRTVQAARFVFVLRPAWVRGTLVLEWNALTLRDRATRGDACLPPVPCLRTAEITSPPHEPQENRKYMAPVDVGGRLSQCEFDLSQYLMATLGLSDTPLSGIT
jgi:hypothetical protein